MLYEHSSLSIKVFDSRPQHNNGMHPTANQRVPRARLERTAVECAAGDAGRWALFESSMNRTSNESRMVTGIAWYRPEQWERLREVSEDVDNLEETYEAWLQTAERLIREGIPPDVAIERVDLDVEEVLAWCNFHGLPMNAQSRSRYVSEKIRKKYDAL